MGAVLTLISSDVPLLQPYLYVPSHFIYFIFFVVDFIVIMYNVHQ